MGGGGGGGGGGACLHTPLQIAAPSTVILKIFSPKLKILDRTLVVVKYYQESLNNFVVFCTPAVYLY